jgi:hypothetical protein
MPIRVYLDKDHGFDAESIRTLGVAFEIIRTALQVEDSNEAARRVIAMKLVELAQQGELDADRLAERLLETIDSRSLPPQTFQQQKF